MPHTMVIAASPTDLERLDALIEEQRITETRWQDAAEQDTDVLQLRRPELRAARSHIRTERDRLREDGTHRVSRHRALAPVPRAELDHRGPLRDWGPPPR
ncbi:MULTISPECIES: hypothetical protein [unclassified Streptomyces]|uniref:hypothetical protein n=1 Tax=unclassified Streptomyces TaxID=2593676 RepID=UPI003662D9FC